MNPSTTATALDPVCGMTIDPKQAAGNSTYEGDTISFCSLPCKNAFDASPEKFAAKKSSCCRS